MKHIIRYTILLLLFVPIKLSAQIDYDSIYQSANKTYAEGEYQLALDSYLIIIDSAQYSADLYYNLANTYYKQEKYPEAILYYEKTLKISPSMHDARYNLNLTQSKINSDILIVDNSFLSRWWKSIINIFSIDLWAILGLILFSIFLASILLFLLSQKRQNRKKAIYLSVISFFFAFIFFSFATIQHYRLKNNTEAIIFAQEVRAKGSPDTESKDIFIITAGIKVKIKNQSGKWYEVMAPNGSIGWIYYDNLELI